MSLPWRHLSPTSRIEEGAPSCCTRENSHNEAGPSRPGRPCSCAPPPYPGTHRRLPPARRRALKWERRKTGPRSPTLRKLLTIAHRPLRPPPRPFVPHPFPCSSDPFPRPGTPTHLPDHVEPFDSPKPSCALQKEGEGQGMRLRSSEIRPPACPQSPPPTLLQRRAPPAVPTPQTTALPRAAAVSTARPTLTQRESEGTELGQK
ncbi:uncharacterized protein LOC120888405 [Ictidomys tridecemlineatus]|uniref:proline-rich proteoglycan 2-like n=1 Tax=Ictidomys tridecemlineatus TaxID=43179 RepID=UPI001A9CFB31|nr:proline-rich proteoglycan 2-like [Ictidomys tridecemlineatus]